MSQPYKICPRCQTPAALDATGCHHCGRQYRTNFVQQTQMIVPPQPTAPPPATSQPVLIAIMWISVPVTVLFALERNYLLAVVCGLISAALGIGLVFSGGRANRINGTLLLLLIGVALVYGVAVLGGSGGP